MKKKFFETNGGKIVKGLAQIIAPNIVSLLERSHTPQEALEVIRKGNMTPEARVQLEQIVLDYESEITKRLESDNKQDLRLPRLVRPLTLCLLTLSYVIGFFLKYPVEVFHTPLMVVFSFYFGGRSVEKLFKKS